jgi:hypothetical protein
VPDRNELESEAMKATFYATAVGVFAMPDGRVEDRAGQSIPGADGWGSDIVGIAEPCGGGSVVIASSASAEREEIRAYQLANGQATSASDATPVPGPVTALWPAESQVQATMVVHNLQTGEYEASRLGLACSQ